MTDSIVIFITVISCFLVVYHHIGYPLLLRLVNKPKTKETLNKHKRNYTDSAADIILPSVTIIIPAYNEEKWIAEKIRNLAALDYPSGLLDIKVGCDGCTDNSYEIALQTAEEEECKHLRISVLDFERNRGKVSVINELIAGSHTELVALSDVSALISIDALLIAAERFQDSTIGVLNSHYRLLNPGSDGERTYWEYQCDIKSKEALLGSTLGAHGALYLFRRELFTQLAPDTINDDFVLPMNIVANGFRAEYDEGINAVELEKSNDTMDSQRRKRIAAGNLQQLWRLKRLLSPSYGGVAFTFFSGKALRVVMPFLMLTTYFGSLFLSTHYLAMASLFALQSIAYAIAILYIYAPLKKPNKIGTALAYLVKGHAANLVGVVRYIFQLDKGHWQSVKESNPNESLGDNVQEANTCQNTMTMSQFTHRSKRCFDVMVSSISLILCLPIFPIIMLLIKLDSPGPIFFKQMRIGRAMPDHTALFQMIKFRTMVSDAEKKTGATWAKKNDPRITPFGRFMRKTRIDELPQFINVLIGDMSIIGPRPERPGFYQKLEDAIPFFAERTYGVSPGITGLAQVNQGYDTCIDDVRTKVGYDHSYALALSSTASWIKMDLTIVLRTIAVMVLGRGQ
ncbi:hypothetical protein A9Q99_01625 [Gammaproteobacteria bacterium 45_16_T64]|nr:hypothetical protein A9Q99_01625 [Gammaproteobacteria bacterium 45_16_T64]